MDRKSIQLGFFFAALAVSAAAQSNVTTTNGGTAGTVPVFTTGSNVENSPISVSGSNVGIGTTTPGALLDVVGANNGSTGNALEIDGNFYMSGSPLYINDTGTLPSINVSKTTGTFPTNLYYSAINVTGDFQHWGGYAGSGTDLGTGVNIAVTNNETSGTGYFLYGAKISATANTAGNTSIGLSVTSASSSGTSYAALFNGGNVGIGTTSPSQLLEVNGAAQVDGALNVGSSGIVFPNGGGTQTTAWTGTVCGGDYAESVNVAGLRTHYGPGDVLVIDPNAPGKFLMSAEPYSTSVAGIYSTKPGLVGRRQKSPTSPDEVPMAMVGIVPTKVTAENGPIHPGDLLVTSSNIGYAMKGTDRGRMLGAVIGKALGKLDSGTGVIEVVVTLQ